MCSSPKYCAKRRCAARSIGWSRKKSTQYLPSASLSALTCSGESGSVRSMFPISAPTHGESGVMVMGAAAPILFACGACDQFRRHQLGRDAVGLGCFVVQLDLDAVRVVEEKLKKRLAIRTPLAERHLFAPQMLEHRAQPGGAERDVIDGARALRRLLRRAAKVLALDLARLLRARPDVHDIDAVHVHPVHREAELGMRAALHAEHARVPVARRVDVVGRDEEVLYVRHGHTLIYTARRSPMYVADAKRLTAAGAKTI